MAPNPQTLNRIQALQDMGIADTYLSECYALNDESNQFFVQIILAFTVEIHTRFGKIDAILKDETVEYTDLAWECIRLAKVSPYLGASRMTNACRSLRDAANDPDNRSRAWCFLKFDKIKCEYAALEPHLIEILKLEGGEFSDEYRLHGYAAS